MRTLIIPLLALLLFSCNGARKNFTLLSGSENEALEPIIKEFAEKQGYTVNFTYKGSVDIMLELQADSTTADAVWPASGLWITLGDDKHKVKYARSILTSPVVFGIKKSLAEKLGFTPPAGAAPGTHPIKVADILAAIHNKQLKFMMTSASQSNSGASAYFGFLYALLGNPEYITKDDLHKPELRGQIRELLSGINRSSGSSGWLKDLFLEGQFPTPPAATDQSGAAAQPAANQPQSAAQTAPPAANQPQSAAQPAQTAQPAPPGPPGNYNAMVNYESTIIETNQELLRRGQEPLYIIYPTDGLVIADSQLGYVDHGDKDKETFFRKLQEYLLSETIQKQLLQLGRRTGFAGELTNAPADIFRADWGIDTKKILSPIKLPGEDVIREALSLYQTAFRKPSLTIFCLDYSASMNDNGGVHQVQAAMKLLLDQDEAKRYFLQASSEDRIIVLPFNHTIIDEWTVDGNQDDSLRSLLHKIQDMYAGGGTDIYSPVIKGMQDILTQDSDRYIPAIILMTDGESNTGKTFEDLKAAANNGRDIPVFAITFGDASETQLKQITQLTRGNLFDGKKDLVNAFRKAKGYN